MPLVEKRYAEALVDLSVQAGAMEDYQKDLETVVGQFNVLPEFKFFLLNPEVRTEIKKDFIRTTFGASIKKEVLNFILLVLDKGRVKYLPGIFDEFVKLADKQRSILNVRIVSAIPLDASQVTKIKEKYIKLYNANAAKVETEIDQGLIGGVKVYIGDKVEDGTVKGKLESLKKLLAHS